jgi:RNA polymerase-binding transcription factor DksA
MTHEADDLDRAATLTQQLADAAVEEAQRAAAPQQVQHADGSWPNTECVCGEAIPEARHKLGRSRCVDCQDLLERSARWRR